MWSSVLVGLIFGLLGGLVIALSVGASIVLTRTSVGLVLAAIQLSGVVLLLGLLGGIVFRVTHRRKIGQPQAVRLWRQLWWNLMSVDVLRSVLAFGLTGIPLTAIGSGLLLAVAAGPLIGIIGGLVGMLSEGIVNGFSTEMLSKRTSLTPNEGIWRSARNAARAGLIGALVSGLLSGLPIGLLRYWLIGGSVHGLPYWLVGGIEYGILGGLLGGLLFGLPNGGIACLQHLGLRCLLWRAGLMPWNYPRFLDYAAEQILLRKVGGGYIFVHRFLLEFFATLQTTPPPESEGRN